MPGFGRFAHPSKPLAIALGFVFVFTAAWVAIAHFSASRDDRYESFYASLADADKAGEITRGWLPEQFLPTSARSIHELHELSPSREWCAFEFLPADSRNLHTKLKHLDVLPKSVSQVPKPGVQWWPSLLVGDLDVEKIHKAGFDLYFAEEPATAVTDEVWLFAIDWSSGRGFFYSI